MLTKSLSPAPRRKRSESQTLYCYVIWRQGRELDFDIPLHTSGRVRGKDDVEIFRPIYIGDTIRAKTKILDINEKEGRSGKMVFVITETQYVNQNQELVMKSRTTVIKR